MYVSFNTNIRPLFRDKDVATMKKIGHFDLSSYTDVAANSDAILNRLQTGDMPCDGAWPQTDVDTFQKWISDGKKP